MNELPTSKDEECKTYEEQEKQELSQIAPDDLTEEQQHKIIDYCRHDPMFFFRYVAQFNIEKTSLFRTLSERLAQAKTTDYMMSQMWSMHDRKIETKHYDIDKLTGGKE